MRHFEAYGRTETGLVREANEDHILLGRFIKNRGALGVQFAADDDFLSSHGMLFAVADGVGGHAGGHAASKLALNTFDAQFYSAKKDTSRLEAVKEALEAAADRANQTLLNVAASHSEWANMGCTLAGVCLAAEAYLTFHAGDSRVYRVRNGFAKQLTSDDSIVRLAVETGQMTPEEAENSPARHTITNVLGSPSFQLHIGQGPALRDGDLLLICSDGLHDMLKHEEIEGCSAASASLESKVDAWIEAALKAGGHDNVSVVAILCKG